MRRLCRAHPPARLTPLATDPDDWACPVPGRIRGTVAMTGQLGVCDAPLPVGARAHLHGPGREDTADPVLRFVPARISLRWHCEQAGREGTAVDVDLADYRTAFPDPMLPLEADWLVHLHREHAAAVTALAAYAAPGVDPIAVRPLVLDRLGVVLRLERRGTPLDVRLAFDQPVRCACDLNTALGDLLDRAMPGAAGLDCAS